MNPNTIRQTAGDGIPTEVGERAGADPAATLAIAQGIFYATTGLWAIVDSRSFQAVTGPKADVWLVKTVGALVTVIGGVLGLASWRRRITPEVPLLAMGSAFSLAAIDVIYVAKGRISRVYLLDAAAEVALVAAWAAALREARNRNQPAVVGGWSGSDEVEAGEDLP